MTRLLACLIVTLGALWSGGARAAEADLYCQTGTSSTGFPIFQPANATNPCPVNATVSASISGFTAASTGTPISVTTGGVTGTLPAGTVVVATNVGATNGAYCALGASATTSSQYLSPGGGWFAFTVLANTQLTCITSTSTTTVNTTGGAGLPTGTGGGGGGGSGGSTNVTQFGGNNVVTGTGASGVGIPRVTVANDSSVIVSSSGLPTGAATAANQATEISSLATIATNTGAAIPAGTALIGKVGIDQTTPGTTNGVANLVLGSGATGGQYQALIVCDKYVFKHITSATDTLAVQGVASQQIRICGIKALAQGTATFFLENTASANANCSSTLAQIDILHSLTAQAGIVDHTPFWGGLSNTSGNGLCINSTGTGGVDVGIYYAQF